jgi:hypothetical protein
MPGSAAETPGALVLTGRGDFLRYRGERPGCGDDPVVQLLCTFGPAVQSNFPFSSVRCPGPRRCDIRRRVLERDHEAFGLLLAGRQQIC